MSENVTIEWFSEQRIVCIALQGGRRTDVDVFCDAIIGTVTTWDKEKPLLIIYDLSHASVTPYSRKRSEDVYAAIPTDIFGRTAIVVPHNPIGFLMKNIGQRYMRVVNKRMRREFFYTRKAAIEWLEQQFVSSQKPSASTSRTQS